MWFTRQGDHENPRQTAILDGYAPALARHHGEPVKPDTRKGFVCLRFQPACTIDGLWITREARALSTSEAIRWTLDAVGGVNQHLKLFFSLDRGFSQADATRIISLVLTFSIAGRLLMGWLADRLPRKYVMVSVFLLIALAIPVLLVAESPAAMTVFAVLFGLGLGGEYLIIPLVAGEIFGASPRPRDGHSAGPWMAPRKRPRRCWSGICATRAAATTPACSRSSGPRWSAPSLRHGFRERLSERRRNGSRGSRGSRGSTSFRVLHRAGTRAFRSSNQLRTTWT